MTSRKVRQRPDGIRRTEALHVRPVNLSPRQLRERRKPHQQRSLVVADPLMSGASSVGMPGVVGHHAPRDCVVGTECSRARGIALYLEDGGERGPGITERLALAQRDVGLLVAPVIAARPGGEEEVGASPEILAHRDRLAEALIETAEHVLATAAGRGLPLVVIAEGVAAAAALRAAARCPASFAALVLVDGRVDLADSVLGAIRVPLLLVVDNRQPVLVALNRLALTALHPAARLVELPADGNSRGDEDCCVTALHVMRGWLATVPALNQRPNSSWTSRKVIRATAARIRAAVTTATGETDPGDASRHLWPAL